MTGKTFLLSALALFLVGLSGCASQHATNMSGDTSQAAAQQFSQLKKLEGQWVGTHRQNDGKEESVSLAYHVTSGGTAIEEKLAEGTPHEMVTMYYLTGPSIAMTHYCILGNQPTMQLSSAENTSDKSSLFFDYAGGTNIPTVATPHMHSLKLTFPDDKHLVQQWTFYEKGAPKSTEVFTFARK